MKPSIATIGLFCVIAPALSAAPSREPGQPGPTASDQLFNRLDQNHDGVLSREEFRAIRPPGTPDKPQPPTPAELFAKADTDGDGSLTLAEFSASPFGKKGEAAFHQLDHNGDGLVSHEEFLARLQPAHPPVKPEPGPEIGFGKLDTDGDGMLTLDELKVGLGLHKPGADPAALFHQLDHNGDGLISHDEFYHRDQPTKPQPPNPTDVFRKLDTDGDGMLTLDEVKARFGGEQDATRVQAHFNQLDTNHDGLLTLDEFTHHAPPQPVDDGQAPAPPANGTPE